VLFAALTALLVSMVTGRGRPVGLDGLDRAAQV
jgi:hypothetical protein